MEQEINDLLVNLIVNHKITVNDTTKLIAIDSTSYAEGAHILDNLITDHQLTHDEVMKFLLKKLYLSLKAEEILRCFLPYVPRINVSQVLDLVLIPLDDDNLNTLNNLFKTKEMTAVNALDIIKFLEYRETVKNSNTFLETFKNDDKDKTQEQQKEPTTWPINVPNCPYYPQFPTTSPYPWQPVWYTTGPWEPDKVYCQCGHCNTAK